MVPDSFGRHSTTTGRAATPSAAPFAFLAVGLPALLGSGLSPSATLLNQAAAIGCWGTVVVVAGMSTGAVCRSRKFPAIDPLAVALLCLGVAGLASMAWTSQPASLTLSGLGTLCAAAVLAVLGARVAASEAFPRFWTALCRAWVVVGALSVAIGCVQVFTPDWADGDWIARPSFPGRAVGNLRQPNHFSSLLLWSSVAVLWLLESRSLGRRLSSICFAAMVAGIVMSASRTGMVGVVLLAVWGLLDKRLSPHSRRLLIASPLVYAAFWLALTAWAHATGHVFGGEGRLTAEGDLSSSRFAIWSNTLALIRQNPWFGVGSGEFNFAWTLTPFPDRPVAFFDHTHNLLLQFAVELGLPSAAVILALLAVALWRAFDASREATGLDGTALRCAFMMVLMMALHSQLEYPLWYAYFLLPTALLWGLCLGRPAASAAGAGGKAVAAWGSATSSAAAPSSASTGQELAAAGAAHAEPGSPGNPDAAPLARPHGSDPSAPGPRSRPLASRLLMLAGAAMMAGGVLVVVDYMKVVAIFAPGRSAAPLPERIAVGQRSWFFAHHADYAAVTTAARPGDQLEAGKRAAHFLLDTRLMIAWSRAYADRGDTDRARHIAARLREFRNPDAAAFFAPCNAAPVDAAARPYQCEPPARTLTYRDFR